MLHPYFVCTYLRQLIYARQLYHNIKQDVNSNDSELNQIHLFKVSSDKGQKKSKVEERKKKKSLDKASDNRHRKKNAIYFYEFELSYMKEF